MKANEELAKLYPDLPYAGDVCVLADWEHDCVRDKGWPFLSIQATGVHQTQVTFIDDEGQLWRGLSSIDWPGMLHCRLQKEPNV